jgi:putative sterol carrier protein
MNKRAFEQGCALSGPYNGHSMTAKELLHKMPAALNRDAAQGVKAVIQYQLSEPLYQVLEDGHLHVHEGTADNPDLTVKMSDENFVKLFKGELNSAMAFMTGKIKLKGDMNLAQQLVSFIDQDKLA